LRFARAVGNGGAVAALLDRAADVRDGKPEVWQLETAGALLDGMEASKTSLESMANEGRTLKVTAGNIAALLDAARKLASDSAAKPEIRSAAIRLMGRGGPHVKEELSVLTALLTPQTSTELQAAAISALGKSHDTTAPQALLLGWRTYSPALKPLALDALLNRPEWIGTLLDAIENNQVPAVDLDAIRRQRLVSSSKPAARDRAQKLFAAVIKPDRQSLVEVYQPALKLTGDAKHGAEVFAKVCAACHNFGGTGNAVGPDLASIGDKSPETLLVSLIDPNVAAMIERLREARIECDSLIKIGKPAFNVTQLLSQRSAVVISFS